MRATQRGNSGLVVPSVADTHDINHPQYRAAAVARLTKFGLSGSPQQRREGREWYDLGHQAVRANQGDLPLRTAAGIASALSPGSDWSKKNVPSIGETQLLHDEDWKMISRTREAGITQLRARRARGEKVPNVPDRHPDVTAMLTERGAHNLAGASDSMLLKAHSMLHGGVDPEDAMSRYDNPKTHAFFHGLLNPDHGMSHLPIDYRMADVVSNEMRSTKANRKLGGGYYKRAGQGKTSYEHHEDIIRMAGQAMHIEGGRSFAAFGQSPLKSQAYLWGMAKDVEQSHPERKMSRKNPGETHTGPVRRGQPYMEGGR